MNSTMESWTVILIGDTGVGKRALAKQFAYTGFEEVGAYMAVGGEFRKVVVLDGRTAMVTAISVPGILGNGPAEHEKMRENYYLREGQAFALVYSVTSLASFKAVDAIHRTVLEIRQARPPFILVGNKRDSEWAREVSANDGMAAAKRLGCGFVETLAKTGQNVDVLFVDVIRMLRAESLTAEENKNTKERGKERLRRNKCLVM